MLTITSKNDAFYRFYDESMEWIFPGMFKKTTEESGESSQVE